MYTLEEVTSIKDGEKYCFVSTLPIIAIILFTYCLVIAMHRARTVRHP